MKKIFQILLIIALLILLGCLGAYYFAVQPVDTDVFDAEPSDDLYTNFLKGAVVNSEYTADQNEINSYLAYKLTSEDDSEKDGWRLTGLYLSVAESRVYARMTDGKTTLYISADAVVSVEGDVCVAFSNVTIGKLPLPDKAASLWLGRIDLGEAEKYISAETLRAHIPSHYGIELEGYGEAVWIDIENVSFEGSTVRITTNPIVTDAIGNFFGYAADNVGEWIAGLFE